MFVIGLLHLWEGLARTMGREDLIEDPRFSETRSRAEHSGELVKLVETWMATQDSDQSILDALAEQRVPCAPVLSVAETIKHPHFIARDMVRHVPDTGIDHDVTIPGFPIKFSENTELPELFTSTRGQDNGQVLKTSLGYSDEQVQELEQLGVILAASAS